MRWRSMFAVLAVVVSACGSAEETGTPPAPVTTHEVPTTTLAGQPSLGDGPENPAPPGTGMTVGGWDIVVEGMATPPDEATLAVEIAATYTRAPGLGRFYEDVTPWLMDPSGDLHPLVRGRCRGEVASSGGHAAGEVLSGVLCFEGAGSLLVVDDSRSAHRVFLATE